MAKILPISINNQNNPEVNIDCSSVRLPIIIEYVLIHPKKLTSIPRYNKKNAHIE